MRRALVVVAAAVVAVALSGCTPTVALTPSPDATAVACARIVVGLPSTIGAAAQRQVDAQGTSAWGDPVSAVMHCGVTPLGPTTDQCTTVSGVDWVSHPLGKGVYRVTTFGRVPATQVDIDTNRIGSSEVLPALSDPVAAATTAHAHCSGDSTTATPSPAASG